MLSSHLHLFKEANQSDSPLVMVVVEIDHCDCTSSSSITVTILVVGCLIWLLKLISVIDLLEKHNIYCEVGQKGGNARPGKGEGRDDFVRTAKKRIKYKCIVHPVYTILHHPHQLFIHHLAPILSGQHRTNFTKSSCSFSCLQGRGGENSRIERYTPVGIRRGAIEGGWNEKLTAILPHISPCL